MCLRSSMKPSTKRLLNLLIIFIIFVAVLYIGFQGNDPAQILQELKSVPLPWLLSFIVAWLLYMLIETVSLSIQLRMQGFKVPYWRMFRVVIIGNYYSSITPSATGGQPIQVHYLKKSGVPIGISSMVLAVRFFVFQLTLLVLGALFWISNMDFVQQQMQNRLWMIWLGFLFNGISVVAVLSLAINGRVVRFLVYGVINLLEKLRLLRNKEKLVLKTDNAIDNFNQSVKLIRRDPSQLWLQFLITSVQFFAIFSVTLLIYHAFGLQGTSNTEVLTMTALLFIAASYTPLPGASGAQEGGFVLFFRGIFPPSTLFSALLLWRFSTYYTTLILGFLLSLFPFKQIESKIKEAAPFILDEEAAPKRLLENNDSSSQ